jgi:DNA recombination protein RmuC
MHDVETKWKLVSQERDALKKERVDWENDKSGILGKLSESLITKGGATFNKTTEELREEFKRVINKVCSLDDDTKKMDKEIDKAVRALLYPGAAGLSSETTLENLLKASGLRQRFSKDDDGDFILQSTFTGGDGERDKRPDAVIYMPNNHYVVIDSKSSSHFLDLQDAVDSGDINKEKDLLAKIKVRMNTHLGDLTSRDYKKAQLDYINAKAESGIVPTVITVMFLQTDKMLDVVRKADKNFEMNAYQKDIFVATPMGLKNLLNSSKFVIAKGNQDLNIGKIKEELIMLLEHIYSISGKADIVGKRLSSALKSYQEFAGIFNRNVLTRGKKLNKLGISSKLDGMKKLDTYEVTKNVVEVEGEIEEEMKTIEE